jgi:pyruvate/2-oxoglutarate dehydrogenase complex dihydrolipoamide acyltransferase (E2) component
MPRVWERVGENSAGDPMFRRDYSGEGFKPVGEEDEGDDPKATKAAIERAEELGVDLADVNGTGYNGRITVGDVEAAA